MSNFGELVRRLRRERGLTLEAVAKKIGSHKGYISGIENGKVNPPSVKIIRKFCRLFSQDERMMVRIAWVDKAPAILKDEARQFLASAESPVSQTADVVSVPLVNTLDTGYVADLTSDGRLKPAVQATLVLPRLSPVPELAATICDAAMNLGDATGFARGEVVLLAREEKLVSGRLVYAVYTTRRKRQAQVRQLMLDKSDHVVLQPLNREYSLEFLSQDDLDAVYRVVGRIGAVEGSPVKSRV